jgi:hypothetical protein
MRAQVIELTHPRLTPQVEVEELNFDEVRVLVF